MPGPHVSFSCSYHAITAVTRDQLIFILKAVLTADLLSLVTSSKRNSNAENRRKGDFEKLQCGASI